MADKEGPRLQALIAERRVARKERRNLQQEAAVAPGVVPDTEEDKDVTRHATFVDNRNQQGEPDGQADAEAQQQGAPETPEKESDEQMAQQDEIEFPTTLEKASPEAEPPKTDAKEPERKQYPYDAREFHDLDPKDYGIDFDEEEVGYMPPDRDEDLPDLDNLLDELDQGESDLESRAEPPSLFTRPEHVSKYKKISELKLQLEEDDIEPYMENFEEGAKDDVLLIQSINLEEVQDEERRLRDEHILYQEQEASLARERQQELVVREESAKKRVAQDLKEKRRRIARREAVAQQKERLMLDRLHKAFRRAENQLVSTLERRKGEVKTMYGDLTMADGHYGSSKGRRWKVDWDKTPQPIQVKLKCLRGVKDKLPAGRYILMVSMYNRLGGHVMRWSNLKGQQWGGATLPMTHDGHYYNYEMKIDQSVFTVLPAKPSVRPGMILVFELFLLRGSVVSTDRVVAWGCFPICDGKFEIIEGKYKAPFLRGPMDFNIDKHETLEALASSDVDHWMSNLYFDIVKLPRYLAGQKEYEVELQFSSGLLSYPDRVDTGQEEYRDGEVPVPGSVQDVNSPVDSRSLTRSNLLKDGSSADVGSASDIIKKPLGSITSLINNEKPGRTPSTTSRTSQRDMYKDLRKRRPMTTYGSRAYNKEKKVKLDDSESSEYEEEDIYLSKKDTGFFPVKGKQGMYYKRYTQNPVDEYHSKLYTLLPKTPILTRRNRRKNLTHLEQLEEHSFAVKQPFSDKGHIKEEGWEKVAYVQRQLLSELGLSQWRSREFWGMLLMFCLVFFLRIYVHYIGQWIFLNIIGIPVNKFEFLPYTVSLNYQGTLLRTREELAIVLLGPLSNILIFILLVLISWLSQRIFGFLPDLFSKFIVAFGIQCLLDPFLILIVDCFLKRYENLGGDNPIADFAKLYWHFMRAQQIGLAGIFITVFLYIFTCFAAGSILYMYFLRLHNNGRLLDVYWRLHGDEDIFFVPYDLELSNQELSYITRKAEQWRGEEGERRKVAVYDYIWEEETVEATVWDENGDARKEKKEGRKEITTHVSIHTVHLDGLRELYRHFLRLPDGAIVEVFGDMAVMGMDKDVKNALVQGAQDVENLGSQFDVRRTVHTDRHETAYTNAAFSLDEETPVRDEESASGPSHASTVPVKG